MDRARDSGRLDGDGSAFRTGAADKAELPGLLGELEAGEINRSDQLPGSEELRRRITELGIVHLRQSDTEFTGSIYVTLELPRERTGGMVSESGDALSRWLGAFLREPQRADVLRKLGATDAPERHAFVLFPGITTAPFDVSDVLMRSSAPLPLVPPDLPSPLTHVWAVSTWNSGDGFRWSPDRGVGALPQDPRRDGTTDAA